MELYNECGRLACFDNQYLNQSIDLFYNIFTSPEWGYDWLEKIKVKRYFEDMLAATGALCYVYLINDELTGACFGGIIDYFRTTQYCIKEIFIDIHKQGRGIGSNMLIAIEDDVRRYGVQNITLNTTREIKAYEFYIKNGYITSPNSVSMVKFLELPRNT